MTLNLVSSENGIFKFLDENGNIYKCGAESEANARELILSNYTPEKELEKAKSSKNIQLKSQCETEILSEFPIYKQLNILALNGYSQADLDNMKAEILSSRNHLTNLEAQVNQASTIQQLESINW